MAVSSSPEWAQAFPSRTSTPQKRSLGFAGSDAEVIARAGREAPTLLAMMGLPKPEEMSGTSLVK